jgi:hypothetical protein
MSDLVIVVDIVYDRDSLGFAAKRTTTRTWICEDGTEAAPKKITEKIYSLDSLSQIQEGIQRRRNIVESLQMPVLGSMLATIPAKVQESETERQSRILTSGRRFLAAHKRSFTNFIEDSNKIIITDIQNADDFWLDNIIDQNGTTIRSLIITCLSIDEPV